MNKKLIELAKKDNIDLEIFHSKSSSVEIETLNEPLVLSNKTKLKGNSESSFLD